MKLLKSGFSLVELIIVIVIIGILIAAIVGLSGSKETAKLVSCKEQILNVKKTTDSYLTSRGTSMYSSLGATSQPQIQNFVSNGYVFPNNPWARAYTITGSAAGLRISTDIGEAATCLKMVTQMRNSASSSACAGSVLNVDFSEWN
jgi:prepilin-type N-terminal cleavage/methylation domain-containing protein